MKPTQLLDARRNIRKEIVAFVSIVMIGLLAALAYLGISYSAAALEKDAVNFFNAYALWDAEVTSTMLFTEEDLTAIRNIPAIAQAEPVWQIDTKLDVEGSNISVSVISLSDTISVPVLLDGRLPETAEECAVEKKLADDCGFTVGQRIRLDCDRIMDIDPLAKHSFVITGVFHTPDHFSYMVPVTPYIFVKEDSFNREGLGGAFMKTRIRVAGTPENRYSDEYLDAVIPVTDALEALGSERAPARVDGIRTDFEKSIVDGESQLEDARAELSQVREKIEAGRQELEAAALQLGEMKNMIDFGEQLLIEAQGKLSGNEEILRYLESIDDFNQISERDWPSGTELSYDEFMEICDSLSEEQRQFILDESRKILSEKMRDAESQLEAGRNNWYYIGEEYLDGVTRYLKGKKQLEEGERELAEGEEKLSSAERELSEARKKLDTLDSCRWVVLNDYGNPGFVYAEANSDKLASLSMSFSSIFLVVGALVIYATISRMVEQQRKLIGVNKALGLYNREIFAKYLIFACSAVLLGIGLGILLAYFPMQRAVLRSYEAHLNYGEGSRSFVPFETGLVVAGGAAISIFAVYLGCSQLLRQSALALMQGATPGSHSRRKNRSSAKKSLYYRLIFRNMLTDWSRVSVTIVSIAGGCLLMVVGFTLRYGISGVPDRQFGGILTYEAEILYDNSENEEAGSEIERILTQNALQHISLYRQDSIFEADGTLNALTVIVAEKETLDGYFALRSITHGEAMDLPDSGALVPRRFWEYYGIDIGESVPIYDSEMNQRQVTIAGVFENYYGQLFFMTPQGYEEAFETAPKSNCFYVKTAGMPLRELQKKLDGIDGLVRVSDAAADRTMIEQFTSSLNLVVWLMLFIAGMMACFIVANFTMTFIQRKTGELTIMRINGFSSGECIRYVAVDLVVTTLLGTLVGLVVGGFMGSRILSVTETPYIQMIREPRLESFLYSALATFGFSVLTNGFALRRIRRLRLSDIS